MMLRKFLHTIQNDIHAIYERDPAARSTLEIIVCYPGLHALWFYRLAHWFWVRDLKLIGRWLSHLGRAISGIEIHPGASIQSGLFIDHGMGVVIGETAEIGKNVTLFHGVTLGGVSTTKGKRHPTIHDDVVIGAGAKVLGAIVVGEASRIGANAVVVKSVPPNSVVVGVPGQIVRRSKPHHEPDLNHNQLPDTIGTSLSSLGNRLEALEKRFGKYLAENPGHNENGNGKNGRKGDMLQPDHIPHMEVEGYWHGEDFMI